MDVLSKVLSIPEPSGSEKDKFNAFMSALSQSKKLPVEDALKKSVDVLTHLEDGKIGVPDLKECLTNLNINLPKETMDEIIASCAPDENGNIQLKDFISGLKEIPKFADSIALQLASSGLENVQDDIIDYDELKNALNEQGLYAASEALTQMLPELAIEQGKLEPSEFMGVLSKVLFIPEASGVKESLSQTNIPKSDEIIPELQERLHLMGIHLIDKQIEEALDATGVNGEYFSDGVWQRRKNDCICNLSYIDVSLN
ncbi:EF-hand calcium-binding domain-containing protein 13-like [Sarcophilus harrisii]|uniref:EF-hand calcium-binding domain-containing protein 13-like n=1 Tax=Sarcophilus harrisii TaxID=9305 RepID=UPI001301A0E6|nr:EF-hand calcium-binding domain-containing protein 13-like [Sarcophilus harrisii]